MASQIEAERAFWSTAALGEDEGVGVGVTLVDGFGVADGEYEGVGVTVGA